MSPSGEDGMQEATELHRRTILAQMLAEQRGWVEMARVLRDIALQLSLVLVSETAVPKQCGSAVVAQ